MQLLQDINGAISGFIMGNVSFDIGCWLLAQHPDVVFLRRRRFFIWSDSLENVFTYRNKTMRVATDVWDGAIKVEYVQVEEPDDQITGLADFAENGLTLMQKSPLVKCPIMTRLMFFSTLALFPLLGTVFLSSKIKTVVLAMWILVMSVFFIVLVFHFLYLNKIRGLLRSRN
jgi:hypothetical protein